MNRLKEYRKIRITEGKYILENKIPFHSKYDQHGLDQPLLQHIIQNGAEVTIDRLSEEIDSWFFDHHILNREDLDTRIFYYREIYSIIQEGAMHIFGLDKDIYNLAAEIGVKPLTIFVEDYMREVYKSPTPSLSTLEYYGFKPEEGWDESRIESSKEFWVEKFIYSFSFNHWQEHHFDEMST